MLSQHFKVMPVVERVDSPETAKEASLFLEDAV